MPSFTTDSTRAIPADGRPLQDHSRYSTTQSPPTSMAATAQPVFHHPFGPPHPSAEHRLKLPPLLRPDAYSSRPDRSAPLVPSPGFGAHYQTASSSTSPSVALSQYASSTRSSVSSHPEPTLAHSLIESHHLRNSGSNPYNQPPAHDYPATSLKRPYGSVTYPPERYTQPPIMMSPAYTDPCSSPFRQSHGHLSFGSRNSISDPITPARTHSLASTTNPSLAYSSTSRTPSSRAQRCSLHIRQQPRAARAGPDGKDRRAIDPPPVLQLMIKDFDPNSEEDMEEIRSSYFVVHCRLISAEGPKKDMSTLASMNDDGSTEAQRLLLGTAVSSPFYCADDPDLPNMPEHPRSASPVAPPSPTTRFIQSRRSPVPTTTVGSRSQLQSHSIPGSFFIFPDLSVRKAGEYRLEFVLMRIEPCAMVTGSTLPIISSVTSQVFRVVNAKDFDQVQPSTDLVKGLLDRGAGFPLKLKKGSREGQGQGQGHGGGNGRKKQQTHSHAGRDADESDDDDDDEEERGANDEL